MSQSVKMQSRIAKNELQVLMKICREIASPRALTVYLLASYNEINQLMALDINPEHYDNHAKFADDYLVTEMLKKSKALVTGLDLEAIAFRKWKQAEDQCKETNSRMRAFHDGLVNPTKPHLRQIVARATELMKGTLGELTRSTLETIETQMDFGPGSTASVKGRITRGRKFTNPILTTSQQLLSFGLFCIPQLWRDQIKGFTVQNFNELSFVPKNAKSHRAITVETDLNVYVQKGIGTMLKRKLRNISIDTRNQQTINRNLASRAYKDGLATIDLSAASDTVSFSVVRMFLTDDWFDLLCWARPEYSKYKGELYSLEKFSGMGCGFTFELETMIFYSILRACKEYRGSVHSIATFGDDMICGLDIMDDVIETLNFLGFSVNSEKTFGKGSFHESCGEDYFKGRNTRPFYLRYGDFNHEECSSLYLYCNLIRRYASHRNGDTSCDARFLPAWLYCFCRIPKHQRVFVPSWDYESCGVVGNFDEAAPSRYRSGDGWSGYQFSRYIRPAVKTQQYHFGAYISALKTTLEIEVDTHDRPSPFDVDDVLSIHIGQGFTHGREAIRGRTRSGTIKTGYTLSWGNLGPWI